MDEAKLIARAKKGDADAFNMLLAQHERKMYGICLKMFSRNEEDAKDCLTDAMMRIYRAISTFKGESAFSTWVYRLTVNTCLDELRRQKRKAATSLEALLDKGWMPPDPAELPDTQVVKNEQSEGVRRVIETLPEDMRAVIILRDIEGYAYDEIAGALNLNVGTVKSRISRARERLREEFKKHPELFERGSV